MQTSQLLVDSEVELLNQRAELVYTHKLLADSRNIISEQNTDATRVILQLEEVDRCLRQSESQREAMTVTAGLLAYDTAKLVSDQNVKHINTVTEV